MKTVARIDVLYHFASVSSSVHVWADKRISLGRFHCVQFFSPFDLRPVPARLLRQGVEASWEICGSFELLKDSRHLVHFPLPCSSLHLECSFPLSRILFSFPRGGILTWSSKTELKCPSVLGKRLPSPSFSKQSSFPPRFVYTCIFWLLPPEYCWLLRVWRSLFPFLESGDHVVLFSESPVLCWILNYGLLLSPEVNHAGREYVGGGFAVNLPCFHARFFWPFSWCKMT